MQYKLCKICIERHRKHPEALPCGDAGVCFICENSFLQLENLCDSALATAMSQNFQYENFSVRTTIARPVLVREEELFDIDMLDSISAKNQFNRMASDYIARKSGKGNVSTSAELVFSLDFWHGKSSAIPSQIFIFAHYRKLSRNYCQHMWICKKCRGRGCKNCSGKGENYPSVEGAIKEFFAPAFGASDAHLHASGREDVDVIMEGGGRPCVIEIVHPMKRGQDLGAIAAALSKKHPIELVAPTFCTSSWVESVCTSHFEKKYRVWIETDKKIEASQLAKLASSAPILLHQRTPVRVSARRSDLVRKRRILELSVFEHNGNSFVLDLRTDAGTYIKEFVHGDEGRTMPNLCALLACKAACKQLNVTGISDEYICTLGQG